MKFSTKYLFSKFDQIRRKPRIWSHLLKKSLKENLIFCAVSSKEKEKQLLKTVVFQHPDFSFRES